MAGSVFIFGNIQSFLQQMFQMLIKLSRLQRRPCQLLEMLSPLQSPRQPFHMGIIDHVLTGESQVLGTDIRSERQLFQSPWLASFSLLSQCPFSYTEPTTPFKPGCVDHTQRPKDTLVWSTESNAYPVLSPVTMLSGLRKTAMVETGEKSKRPPTSKNHVGQS